MKYLKINLENNKSVLVDESAEVIPVDTWCQGMDGVFQYKGKVNIDNGILPNIIITTINHSISLDVPMVVIEDEVENLAEDSALGFIVDYKPFEETLHYKEYVKYGYLKGFIEGFKAPLQKEGFYSQDEVVRIMEKYLEEGFISTQQGYEEPLEFIQSLNKNYIELDTERKITVNNNTFESLKTYRDKSGQLMASIKK